MKFKKGIFLIYLFSFCEFLNSQNLTLNRTPCDNVVYYLHFYNVKRDTLNYRNNVHLATFVNSLNTLFKDACIQFQVCKIDSIHDYNYDGHGDESRTNEKDDMIDMWYDPYSINIYWVSATKEETFNGICQPSAGDMEAKNRPRILINYNSAGTLEVEDFRIQMCRYFGLPYTESTLASRELVNGSNGLYTADSAWDTPADPNALIGVLPNTNKDTFLLPKGQYYYYNSIKDANGEYYNPMIYNLMGRYSVAQKCTVLTPGQYQFLVRNERRCRKIRWE